MPTRSPRFTLGGARALLPALDRMTREAALRLEDILSGAEEEDVSVAAPIDDVFTAWSGAVELLGARSAGLWAVEFWNGDGFYCWRWPEPDLVRYRPGDEAQSHPLQ